MRGAKSPEVVVDSPQQALELRVHRTSTRYCSSKAMDA
jgi:hypothetical protein